MWPAGEQAPGTRHQELSLRGPSRPGLFCAQPQAPPSAQLVSVSGSLLHVSLWVSPHLCSPLSSCPTACPRCSVCWTDRRRDAQRPTPLLTVSLGHQVRFAAYVAASVLGPSSAVTWGALSVSRPCFSSAPAPRPRRAPRALSLHRPPVSEDEDRVCTPLLQAHRGCGALGRLLPSPSCRPARGWRASGPGPSLPVSWLSPSEDRGLSPAGRILVAFSLWGLSRRGPAARAARREAQG